MEEKQCLLRGEGGGAEQCAWSGGGGGRRVQWVERIRQPYTDPSRLAAPQKPISQTRGGGGGGRRGYAGPTKLS